MKWLEKLVQESRYSESEDWVRTRNFQEGAEWMAAQIKAADSCLGNVEEGEPIFVLRAQDKMADGVVDFWIECLLDEYGEHLAPALKLEHARDVVVGMKTWPNRRVPD